MYQDKDLPPPRMSLGRLKRQVRSQRAALRKEQARKEKIAFLLRESSKLRDQLENLKRHDEFLL